MSKATLLSILFCGLTPGILRASAGADCVQVPYKYSLGTISTVPFHAGEKFTYAITYGFIKAGQASMEVQDAATVNCRPTFQIVSKAESVGVVDTFFTVRDFNTAVIDKESLMPFFYHQNLHEGHFKVLRNTTFDYVNATYKWEKQYKGKNSSREGPLPEPVHDILSAFFTARTLPLELGGNYEIHAFSDADFYQLKIHVASQLENIKTALGVFPCIRIDPVILGDGIFKMQDGKLQMWLTADERHIPVLIRSKVSLGAFNAELVSFDTPQIDMVKEKVPTR